MTAHGGGTDAVAAAIRIRALEREVEDLEEVAAYEPEGSERHHELLTEALACRARMVELAEGRAA